MILPPSLTDHLRELRNLIGKEIRRLRSLKNPRKWLRKVKRMLAE